MKPAASGSRSPLSRGVHLVLPDRSHNDLDPCVARIIETFLPEPGEAEDRCLAEAAPFSFEVETTQP